MAEDMQCAKLKEGEPEVVTGPKTGPAGDPSSRSGSLQQDSPMVAIKEEAAGDTSYASSIDAMYPDPSDSFPGGLFPGSASFDWSSLDSSSEGRNLIIGGVAGQETNEEKSSRPGNSRIPGKDHRRYYHNHWRLEYLMDYNPRCHSMICMVCGSSLATLKLSTIKRHICQMHPYSLYWTPCEKEVIIGSWDAHLCVDAQTLAGSEEHMAESMKARTGPKKKRRRLPPVAKGTWRPVLGPEFPPTSPLYRTHLEQYMNESLKQWFRLEFLMDYDYQENKLHCMMCTNTLSSLSLTDIKHHILDNHPISLQFTPTQKGVILNAWINRNQTPEVKMEEDLTPKGQEDLTPEVEEDLTSEVEVEEDITPVVDMDLDMDDDEADKLAKKEIKGDQVASTTIKLKPKNRMLKSKGFGDSMEKYIKSVYNLGVKNNSSHSTQLIEEKNLGPTDFELLEEEESPTGDIQLLDNKDHNAKPLHLLADQEWKARKKQLLELKRQILQEQQKVKEKKRTETRKGQSMVEEKRKTKESHLLMEEQKTRERQLEDPEKTREPAVLKEEKQKAKEAKLLEDVKRKDVQLLEGEWLNAKAAQLLEEDKRKAKELELLEEEKNKGKEAQSLEKEKKVTMEAQLLEEEGKKAKEAQLRLSVYGSSGLPQLILAAAAASRPYAGDRNLSAVNKSPWTGSLIEEENKTDKEAQLLEEKSKIREVQVLQEQGVEEGRLEQEKPKEQEGKLKETQGLSKEVQSVTGEIIVKIEDHQYAELPKIEKESQTAKNVQAEKQEINQKIMEGAKTQPNEPGKHQMQVQQVQQAPAVLGIGLPVLKVKTPTPIIITRVSVIPEHTILQTSKPVPSTSVSDISKTWRVIAPKVSPVDLQTPQLPPANIDIPPLPAGVDPTVWEVSVWRGNSASLVPNNAYQMRWRSDFLMDFNGVRGSVVCMYCSSALTVLKESSIKRHIAQKHPHTGNFNAEEKAAIILDWENKLSELKRMSTKSNKDGDQGLSFVKASDCDSVEAEEEEPSWSGVLPEGKGASWEFAFGRLQGKEKDPRKYQHDRWNLEFLMDYTPAKDGLICMVCGATLMNPKITTVKMHIQQKHPDTTYLSDQEKAVVMEEWEQKMAAGKKAAQQQGEDEICIEINEDSTNSETNGVSVAASSPHPEIILPTFSKTPKSTPSLQPPCNSAKPNYQVRWRTEFMMDYDCRRQGLICMVCGGTLATLKVSTIKRHIVQVHPYSVDFTAEERQRILEAYSEMALHYIHSEDCFKPQPLGEVKGCKRKALAMEES